ncbi:MAG: VCBS repeat-containing protein [Planctomycetes bacterium]|nr:VCBS repeat-containing protein [Planctomycetota bacterium]
MLNTVMLLSALMPIPQGPQFAPPVRLKGGDAFVAVEAPGFAAPSWHDVDGDGRKDLVVGQFRDGKMHLFKNEGDGKLAAGTWIMAEGNIAQVPGVW